MADKRKIALFAAGGFFALLILAAVAPVLLADVNAHKPRLEAAASDQSFNLVDVGAFFIAGPFAPLVTKGYDFASLFPEPGGGSRIRTLVSEWKVERGVARAKDVAMATNEHRVAHSGAKELLGGRCEAFYAGSVAPPE